MPRGKAPQSLSPGQAQYVVNRLIAERRISPGEVARYVGEIQRDIADIEARLARLRDGSFMGFMRQVTGPRKKAEFRKIKEQHGYERAIAAIKQHLGK